MKFVVKVFPFSAFLFVFNGGLTFNRKGAAGAKGQKCENDPKKSRELRTVAGHDPNSELARSMQVILRFPIRVLMFCTD